MAATNHPDQAELLYKKALEVDEAVGESRQLAADPEALANLLANRGLKKEAGALGQRAREIRRANPE